jgi:hypothetical protein
VPRIVDLFLHIYIAFIFFVGLLGFVSRCIWKL